jgi:hypothetical protein
MTLREFALSIVNDAQYRATLATRAYAGTLPEEVELFLLELADGRVCPQSANGADPSAPSRTLAVIRPRSREASR